MRGRKSSSRGGTGLRSALGGTGKRTTVKRGTDASSVGTRWSEPVGSAGCEGGGGALELASPSNVSGSAPTVLARLGHVCITGASRMRRH